MSYERVKSYFARRTSYTVFSLNDRIDFMVQCTISMAKMMQFGPGKCRHVALLGNCDKGFNNPSLNPYRHFEQNDPL